MPHPPCGVILYTAFCVTVLHHKCHQVYLTDKLLYYEGLFFLLCMSKSDAVHLCFGFVTKIPRSIITKLVDLCCGIHISDILK